MVGEITNAYSPGLRVLHAEDEVHIRQLVGEFLESQGFVVVSTPDAEDAIAALEVPGCRYDLVITDLQMPGVRKGDAVARKARDMGVPVIILSGCGLISEEVPHDRLVGKPFTFGNLMQAVHGVLPAP